MTLIECFDRSPLRNMAACLRLQPDKLIFMGDEAVMESHLGRYRSFLAQRSMNTKVISLHISLGDMDDIIAKLGAVVRKEDSCVIDITGGEERLVMAVGAVLAGLDEKKRKSVTVQKFELVGGRIFDCDGDGRVLAGRQAELTIRELIGLHGGTVYPAPAQLDKGCKPEDIQPLWELVCRDSKSWNKTISYLNEFESRADSQTEVYLPLDRIARGITNFEEKEEAVRTLLDRLDRCGVITDRSSARVLHYEYRDNILRECVKKAGNILEIKTLLEARALQQEGRAYFCDCQMGVHIDWDGVVYDPEKRIPETRNEIDVLVVRGMTPLFISCKNGDIGDEELYKLNTVAERFGSPYAKKMLIATDLQRKGPMSLKAYIQRAKDMDIYLVTDAAELTAGGWRRIFLEAMGE